MPESQQAATRRPRPIRESAAMLAGTTIGGLCAYIYIAIGTRAYGDEAMAPIAVLWTFWAISVALFTFPIQHWAIRKISVDGHTQGIGCMVPRLTLVVVSVAAAMAVGAGVYGERVFGSGSLWWPLLVFVVTIGSGFVGLQRGVLAGRGRYYATASNIAAENVLRVVLGLVVAATIEDVVAFAWVLAMGPIVAVFWPEAVKLPFRGGVREPVLGFLGGLAGGILIAQVILNAGPLILQGLGATDSDVTGLFLVLALFRAPYLLALGVATRLTAPLTGLVVAGRTAVIRRIVVVTVGGSIAVATVAGVVGYVLGPWIIRLVFAPETDPAAMVVAFISGGSLLALGGLGLILVLVAQGRTTAVQFTWLVGLAVGVVTLALAPGDPTARVVAAFVAAEATAFLAMTAALMIDRPVASPVV